MKIKVSVNTTKKDYLSFHMKTVYRSLWIYVLLVVLVIALLVMNIQYHNRTGKTEDSLIVMLIMACFMLLYVLINNIIKLVKAAKKEKEKPVFEYTFTKGGMHCDSNGRSLDLTWQEIYKVVETKKMFLVYLNKSSAFIIPKSAFESDEDIELFSSTLLFEPKKYKIEVKKNGRK